jgi:hypothetical protein
MQHRSSTPNAKDCVPRLLRASAFPAANFLCCSTCS